MRQWITISLVAAAALFAPTVALTQISPGELARAHASLEGIKNCTKCHELGAGPSAEKCLACHGEIAEQLDAKRGYHHRAVTAAGKACFECHSDHAGRSFELVHWPGGRDSFDHAQAGWPLGGAHARKKCRDCHTGERVGRDFQRAHPSVNTATTFLGLDGDCLGCHADPHAGQFARGCADCHGDDAWKPATRFDHTLTKFQLHGAHVRVECVKCHVVEQEVVRYAGIAGDNCTACHTDPHAGRMGADCASCHGDDAWKPVTRFDHARTAFPLTGLHAQVACDKCHLDTAEAPVGALRFASVTIGNCVPCHSDPHEDRLGADCASCHTTGGWKIVEVVGDGGFDHGRTRFALIGLHKVVACEKCHTAESKTVELVFDRCERCHADAHEGQFAGRVARSACQDCHDENGFKPARFTVADHANTRFALAGAHLAQPCVACHRVETFPSGNECRRFVIDDTRCEACHTDVHAGQFAATAPVRPCGECHTLSAWRDFGFDHDKNTSYRLEAKHRSARCDGCHPGVSQGESSYVRYRGTPTACEACHTEKDLQLGGTP